MHLAHWAKNAKMTLQIQVSQIPHNAILQLQMLPYSKCAAYTMPVLVSAHIYMPCRANTAARQLFPAQKLYRVDSHITFEI